jgi:hypothetical protein
MRLKFDHRLISYYLEQEIEKIWTNGDLIPYIINAASPASVAAVYLFTDNYHKGIIDTNYYIITFYHTRDEFHGCYVKPSSYTITDNHSKILYNINFENFYDGATYKGGWYKDLAKHLAEDIAQKIKETEEKAGREPV